MSIAAFIRRFFAAPDYLGDRVTPKPAAARPSSSSPDHAAHARLLLPQRSRDRPADGRRSGELSSRFPSQLAGCLAGQSRESRRTSIAAVAWWLHAVVLLDLPAASCRAASTCTSSPPSPTASLRSLETLEHPAPRDLCTSAALTAPVVSIDFSWKDLFDGFTCTECGRCQDVCPAQATGKPLNPRQVVHDIKDESPHQGPALSRERQPLIGRAGRGASPRKRSGPAPPAAPAWRSARS